MVRVAEPVYPVQYETEALLKDGTRIKLRPIRRSDTRQWLDFICRLSPHTKYLRFHHIPKQMTMEDASRYCTVDYINTFAFVAETLLEGKTEIVAIGRYYRLPNDRTAEIAFVIEDAFQEKGLGTKLMEWLVNVALDNSINVFEADVLAENEQMLIVFRDYGFHIESELEGGIYHITVKLNRTPEVQEKEQERERISTLASLRPILFPKAVAVIGASRRQGTIGNLLLQCLVQNYFTGTVYPVNPTADSVLSIKAYPSILTVPGKVDMALIAVPAPYVAQVADECGRKGVRALIVISDGFRETGPEGAERERVLREIALGHGMRLIGPNCMGVINTNPAANMNATFSRVYPPAGNVALLSQSGAMGLVVLDYARSLNLGISTFVSLGNRADVSYPDFLQYWEQDKATDVILLYLESFGDPRKFSRLARRVSAKKPIVVVKGGTTSAGSRAAMSHTGALAVPEAVSDALFQQAGIMRVSSIEELFDVATFLSNQPLPKGRRIAILTNGGGPGIIAADAAQRQGLTIPQFSPATVEKLKPAFKRDLRFNNPLDTSAGASAEEFEKALDILAEDPNIDGVLAIFIPPVTVEIKSMEEAISRVAKVFKQQGKPIAACFMGERGFKTRLGTEGSYVPCYPFPEGGILALARAADYAELRAKPRGTIPTIKDIDRAKAQDIIGAALSETTRRPLWLSTQQIADLLECYGIRFAETVLAKAPSEAARTAERMGFPVAVKLASATISHKTEVGGVVLDVKSAGEVEQAFNDIKSRLAAIGREAEMDGVTIQHMVKDGIEVIVGVSQDPSFGPVIMFGIGGIYAELLKDVAFKLHPLTDLDASELLRSVKMAKLFEGFRGSPPTDTAALEDLLLRLSAMIEDLPEICELDFNPVKAMPDKQGYWIVDARIAVR